MMKQMATLLRGRLIFGHLKKPKMINSMSTKSSGPTPAAASAAPIANPGNPLGEIKVSHVDTKRIITLSRPKALNALSLHMIRQLYPAAKNLDHDPKVNMIILKGDGGKAFCAGGDVRSITEAGKKGDRLAQDFFREEYNMNYALGTCPVPVVAIIDGITMGGGVGISVHGPFRVATERTLFAMPETAIGLFPDVGGSYFMPRLRGKLGLFLGLTGYRLRGWDCLEAGIATHYVNSQLLNELEQALLDIKADKVNKASINQVLESYQKESLQGKSHQFSLQPHLASIDQWFGGKTVEEIFQRLEKDGSKWALDQLATMKKMSPTSMKVTMRQLEYGAKKTLKECFHMEYRMAQHFIADHDFYEGVRAVLVEKDNAPRWKPATLEEVTDEKVDWYFSPLGPDKEIVISDNEDRTHGKL